MKKTLFIVCTLLIVLLGASFCYADGPGRRHGGGYHHGHHHRGGWGIVVFPAPVYPYPVYPPPICEKRCYEREVPVCHYDSWGDRWCRNSIVRECSRVCY